MMEAFQPKKARIIDFSLCVIYQNNVKIDKMRTITKPGRDSIDKIIETSPLQVYVPQNIRKIYFLHKISRTRF